jgi:hypothetical protein
MMGLRESDMMMLQELLDDGDDKLTEWEQDAFRSMLDALDRFQILTSKQRDFVKKAHERFHPVYENLVSEGKVPRGKEVPEPEALRHKPLKPPGRA